MTSLRLLNASSRPIPDYALNQEDLSSPEDETACSFHTPKHAQVTNASSMYSFVTSQDSLDIFHDAFSSLHLPQNSTSPPPLPPSPSHLRQHRRRRHFSSGAKLDDKRLDLGYNGLDWEEADEQTCMLPKSPLSRIRYSSQGQVSRSCNASPFRSVRSTMSTNSQRPKSVDRVNSTHSPQKQTSDVQGGSLTNYVPYVEVEMICETDEGGCREPFEKGAACIQKTSPRSGRSSGEPAAVSPSSTPNGLKPWKINYVPYADVSPTVPMDLPHQSQTAPEMYTRAKADHNSSSTPIRRKRGVWHRIRDEFALTNLKFDHHTPHLFVTSQWQRPDQMCCMYLAYRLFWGVYFTLWGVWSWVGFGGYDAPRRIKPLYLIYLTDWGIWLLALDTMFQATIVCLHIKKIAEQGDARYLKMKTRFKMSWILSNLTTTLQLFITVIFWTSIFPYGPYSLHPISVNTHIVPGLYALFDLLISATPRRIFHAYLCMGLVTVYGAFTDIYYLAGGESHRGGTALYPVLDWSEPAKTLLVGSGLVLILIPFIHVMVVCVLYGLRLKLWRSLNYSRCDLDGEIVHSKSMEEKV